MHTAPSVVFPVGRCVFHLWLLGLLGALSAVVWFLLLVWSRPTLDQPWSWVVSLTAIFSVCAWVCVAVLSWVRSPEGMLVWNAVHRQDEGEVERGVWFWRNKTDAPEMSLRELQRVLDLQDCVLLRVRFANASVVWIWAERRRDPARWSDLRRALVSSGT